MALPDNEKEFDEAMRRLEAKLNDDEHQLLAIAFAGAQVNRTIWYMVASFLLGILGGAALWAFWVR